ncbi:hypothetical protein I552_1360 [Mycobacterium xenopi 3993]|nr:hypothetical protein I552_1360 [Mycobacterium xenopi 3993]
MISPGGVGFDISCGVRMLSADLERGEFAKVGKLVMDRLSKRIPRGAGPGAVRAPVSDEELDQVLRGGSRYVVEHGDGPSSTWTAVRMAACSRRPTPRRSANARGRGDATNWAAWVRESLPGSPACRRGARRAGRQGFRLRAGQVCVMIHCGSRDLGTKSAPTRCMPWTTPCSVMACVCPTGN